MLLTALYCITSLTCQRPEETLCCCLESTQTLNYQLSIYTHTVTPLQYAHTHTHIDALLGYKSISSHPAYTPSTPCVFLTHSISHSLSPSLPLSHTHRHHKILPPPQRSLARGICRDIPNFHSNNSQYLQRVSVFTYQNTATHQKMLTDIQELFNRQNLFLGSFLLLFVQCYNERTF